MYSHEVTLNVTWSRQRVHRDAICAGTALAFASTCMGAPMSNEWNDLVADEKARRCARCGQHTAFAARIPKPIVVGQERTAGAVVSVVWCFECGHEERQEPD